MCLFQAEDGIRHMIVTGVRTCALPICRAVDARAAAHPLERIYQALQEGRGGARVDSPTAESKYRALERYSIDLTEDRKSGVEGKSVDLGGRRIIAKKKQERCHGIRS